MRRDSQCYRVAAPIAMETMSLFLAFDAELLSRTFELHTEVFLLLFSTVWCHVHTQAKYLYSAKSAIHPELPPEECTKLQDQ